MKKLIALLLALVMVLSMASCGSGSNDAEQEPESETKAADVAEDVVAATPADSLTIGMTLDVESFNPWLMANDARQQVFYNKIYETLAFLRPDGSREYVIAKSVEPNGDGCYKVILHDNVFDSNGNQITASDIVFSYNQCFATGQLAWGIKYLDHFDIVNDFELDMYLNQESAVALDMVLKTCHIVDEDSFNASADSMATTPVGTGPYVLESYTPGSEVVLTAREDYWQTDESMRATSGAQGSVKTVTYKVISDSAQLALALEMGDIDASINVSVSDLDTFLNEDRTAKEGYNVVTTMGALLYYIAYNCSENSPLQDQTVRQAVSYAIDMETIAQALYGDDGSVAHTNSSVYYSDYDESLNDHIPYQYNVEKAKQLLADAGYSDGDITLELITNTEFLYAETASMVQYYLKEVGINVNISTYESAMFNTLINDPTGFDMYMNCTMSLNTPGRMGLFDLNGYSTGVNGVFVNDPVLQEKFETANLAVTYNKDTVTDLLNYVEEMAYNYPMYYAYNYIITRDNVTDIVYDRNNAIVPNACTVIE